MIRQLAIFVALLALACGPDITTQYDSSIPLPAAPTWAWGRRDTVSHYELDPAAQNPVLHDRVQQAIDSTLAHKGWKEVVDPAKAQLVVTYHVGLKRSVALQTTSTAVGGGWWGGYRWGYYGAPTYVVSTTTPVEYAQGGLLVVLRDGASGNVVWRGLYKKEVQDTHKVTQQDIQRAVNDLLRGLK